METDENENTRDQSNCYEAIMIIRGKYKGIQVKKQGNVQINNQNLYLKEFEN